MNHLLRGHAPLTDSNWKLLDVVGPQGWEHSSTNLGRVDSIDVGEEGVTALQRRVLPLVEVRVDFTVSRSEMRDDDRGAVDVDLESLDLAAHQIAIAENSAVFNGWAKAGIQGVVESSPFEPEPLGTDADAYPRSVARAVEGMREAGVEGPYGLALGPDEYIKVIETAEHGGYPLFEHLGKILGQGPIVWSPGLSGAVAMSLRGGDFLFESGQDLSIGYSHHDANEVNLYLEESFSFVVATPEAAAPLTP